MASSPDLQRLLAQVLAQRGSSAGGTVLPSRGGTAVPSVGAGGRTGTFDKEKALASLGATNKAGLKKGPPSLLRQGGDMVAGFPSALFHMLGHMPTAGASGVIGSDPIAESQRAAGHNYQEGVALGQSAQRTGSDLLDPGRAIIGHPTHYGRYAKEGTTLSHIVEDAANLAVVLGPLSKGAGSVAGRSAAEAADAAAIADAARSSGLPHALSTAAEADAAAAKAATRASRFGAVEKATGAAEKVAMRTGNAPIYPFELASKIPGWVDDKFIGGKIGSSPLGEKASGVVERVRTKHQAREDITNDVTVKSQIASNKIAKSMLEVRKLVPHADEMAALTLIAQKEVAPLVKGFERLPQVERDAALSRVADEVFAKEKAGKGVTPEAVRIAVEHAYGTLDPEIAGRLDQAHEILRRDITDARTARAISGQGREAGP